MRALHAVVAVLLGAVFVYASLDKIADPPAFARIVYHYQVIGPGPRLGFLPANTLAVALPWVEALTGVLLIAGVWRREAALVAALLLLMFVVAVGWTVAHGIDVDCGCFTVRGEGRRAGWGLIAGDLALLGAALFLLRAKPAPEPSLATVPSPTR